MRLADSEVGVCDTLLIVENDTELARLLELHDGITIAAHQL